MFDVKYPTLDSVGLCLNFHKLTISNIIHVHWPIIKDVNTRSATIFPKISLAILNDVIPITKLIRNHLMPMEIYMLSLCLFNNKMTRRPIVTQYCIKRFNTAFNVYFNPACVWGLWCRRQMSRADIGICIPQYPLGCDCLSVPVMPPPGAGDLIHMHAYVNERVCLPTQQRIPVYVFMCTYMFIHFYECFNYDVCFYIFCCISSNVLVRNDIIKMFSIKKCLI